MDQIDVEAIAVRVVELRDGEDGVLQEPDQRVALAVGDGAAEPELVGDAADVALPW